MVSDWSIRIRIWRIVWLGKYRFSTALLDFISSLTKIFSMKKPKSPIFDSLNLVNMKESIFQNWRNCRCEIDKTLLTYQNIHEISAVQKISSNLQNRSAARPKPCHLPRKILNFNLSKIEYLSGISQSYLTFFDTLRRITI